MLPGFSETKGFGAKTQHTTTISFSDPFGRLLGLTTAKHTTLVMDMGRTVPEPSLEEPEPIWPAPTGYLPIFAMSLMET